MKDNLWAFEVLRLYCWSRWVSSEEDLRYICCVLATNCDIHSRKSRVYLVTIIRGCAAIDGNAHLLGVSGHLGNMPGYAPKLRVEDYGTFKVT